MLRLFHTARLFNLAIATLIIAGTGALAALDEQPSGDWLRPQALVPGDTIALVAPAGPIKVAHLKEYTQSLEKAGYHVQMPQGIERTLGYLAGTDQERADELNAAIRDPKVRAIFPCQGGYGLTRILDRIDYAALRDDPKIITGFSDLTALHLAIARQARVVSFHSPMPLANLWKKDQEHAFAAASFQRAVFADQYKPGSEGYTIDVPSDQPRPKTLVGGKTRGRLAGGNLTLLSSTLGTPYAIDPRGRVLVIEDVHEAPYRIDRYLSQLRLAGILDGIVGVVAGDFRSNDAKDLPEFDRVLRDYFSRMKKPVILNFPVGHIARNATLPLGALVELDGDAGSLRVLENPVRLERRMVGK
jgi:muramoyltetrapeptide carboxypeptidase